jgi:hypothetical protein
MRKRVSLPRPVLPIALAVAVVGLAVGSNPGAARSVGAPWSTITVEARAPVGVRDLLMGVTHAQESADPGGNPAAEARA